jgi:type III secretory pathway component EscU
MLGSFLMIVFILFFFSVAIQDFSFVGKKNEKQVKINKWEKTRKRKDENNTEGEERANNHARPPPSHTIHLH